MQQKFDALSKAVLAELASNQESAIIALTKKIDAAKKEAQDDEHKTKDRLGQHLERLAQEAQQKFEVAMNLIEARVQMMDDKVSAAQVALAGAASTLEKKRHLDRMKHSELLAAMQALEQTRHVSTHSVAIQCERPRSSLRWEPEALQGNVDALSVVPNSQLVDQLRSPVIQHLLQVWNEATMPLGSSVSLRMKAGVVSSDEGGGNATTSSSTSAAALSYTCAADDVSKESRQQGCATEAAEAAANLSWRDRILQRASGITGGGGGGGDSSAMIGETQQDYKNVFAARAKSASSAQELHGGTEGAKTSARAEQDGEAAHHASALQAAAQMENFLLGRSSTAATNRGDLTLPDSEALRMLVDWLSMVLDSKREQELYGSTSNILELNHLPLEIYSGVVIHLLPLLQQRAGVAVTAERRIRDTFDIRLSVTHLLRDGDGTDAVTAATAAARASDEQCANCVERLKIDESGEGSNPWSSLSRIRVYSVCPKCNPHERRMSHQGQTTIVRADTALRSRSTGTSGGVTAAKRISGKRREKAKKEATIK